MKHIIGLAAMLLPILSARAQAPTIKALTIGDTVPDITITNVYNYPSSTIRLSDLKGKLVILDFMATTCVPCIKVLPRFDSLQKQYGKRIQIILVSPENAERIQSFLKKNNSLQLPLAADSNVAKYFPHTYISHVGWINPNGIVCAITHTEYVNFKNNQTVLKGQKINWPVKRDIPDYDYSHPLLKLNVANMPEESLPAHCYYTAIINYLPGVQKYNKVVTDSINNTTHTSLINFSILDLYEILYNRIRLPLTQLIIQVKNEDRLIYNPNKEYFDVWVKKNAYCIEATLPASTPLPEQKEKLIKDIDFYLGLNTSLKMRTVNCLVLKNIQQPIAQKDAPKTKGLRIEGIVSLLNNRMNEMPVIDETTNTAYLGLPVTESQVTDTTFLKKILNQYGVEMTTEKREIEFLVITDALVKTKPIINSKNNDK